jgi:hypothetical protein
LNRRTLSTSRTQVILLAAALYGPACHCESPAGGGGSDAQIGPNGSDGQVGDGAGGNGEDGAGGGGGDGAATSDDVGGERPDAGSSTHVVTCPSCPCFPGTDCTASGADAGQPTACTGAGEAPTLVYPPDKVLLPPNTNVIEVQFLPGAGNTLFEIDFANASTDVRISTRCNPITNTRGGATGGCGFVLDMANWHYVADVNRGGDPVEVTIRATPDGMCVGKSATREISFATEDLLGAIYYWQSVTVMGTPGRAGGIYRYDFGREDIAPEPFLESSPTTGNRCIGCHFVSRDGVRMSFGSDDPDSDDEYGDLSSLLIDIATRNLLAQSLEPGFRTFNKDHTSMLDSDGAARNTPPAFFRYSGDTGDVLDKPPTGTKRGTQPDWAPDDSKVVFVEPTTFLLNRGGTATTHGDDSHFIGGSLFTMTWNGSAFSAPQMLLASMGENNFYPAYSSDSAFIVFNRVRAAQTGTAADAFSNPNAEIWAMAAAGGAPVELARLNQGPRLSNSWPRFSPFVQQDRGHRILWVTFSSTRDYGLRVQNQDPTGVFCYPPESPENDNRSHQCPLVPTSCGCTATACPNFCVQPQIWMAAVEVDANGGISAGRDTSHPAFWLPFQEISAHNHIAQWVAAVPGHELDAGTTDGAPPGSDSGTGGAPDGAATGSDAAPADSGTCGLATDMCGPGFPLCCSSLICSSGHCVGV